MKNALKGCDEDEPEDEEDDKRVEQATKFMVIGRCIINTHYIKYIELERTKDGCDASKVRVNFHDGDLREWGFDDDAEQKCLRENVRESLDVFSVNLTNEQVENMKRLRKEEPQEKE